MSEQWILLPAPQHVEALGGTFKLEPGRFIWLQGDFGKLLRAGQIVQEALVLVGPPWDLTAARGDNPAHLGAVIHVDPAQVPQPEGYHLTILPGQLRITAHDPAGAFYAAMTLRQLARAFAGAEHLPCLRIEDWPDFSHRGVMLDISRDKVPTMETLYALVDTLAEWKLNQFQLYTEHTFAYRNHREVWENASPMTGEEVMLLDAYCRERFIELVPNQNSFAHMTRWLAHPRYIHLAEAPEGFEIEGTWREGPFSLCPLEPGSLALLAELYDELLPHFSSTQFNVGCDETFDLGQGRSKAACQERGVGRVYLEFLLKIHDLVQKHGRTMQFWGDIVQNHPELIPELPGDIIALEWGYEAEHPFAERGERLARAGIPYYVCPSTSTFLSVVGRADVAIANLRSAAENGLAHRATGYLNTDWGDGGHWQPLPVSFLGYAYGAAMSWAAQANRDLDLPQALDAHAFQDRNGVMGRLALELGHAYKKPGVLTPWSSALVWILLEPEKPIRQGKLAGLTVEGLERTEAYIKEVISRLPNARMARPDADLIAEEFRNATDLLRHACRLGIARLQAEGEAMADIPAQTRQSLASELQEIVATYRRLWLARNRVGGLEDSAGRLEKLLAMYQSA